MQKLLNVRPLLTDLPFEGADWNRVDVVRVVDGDTLRLLRSQVRWTCDESEELGDNLIRSEWRVIIVEDDINDLEDGLSSRLVSLDTPERGDDGFKDATTDLLTFCLLYKGRLRCVTYDGRGGFDRLLVDLYVLNEDGTFKDSASQWMMRERGWAPYVK